MHPLPASLGVLLLGGIALAAATDGFAALTSESARRLAAARDGPHMPQISVETMSGARMALPATGQATVVEFIYTTCPDICQIASDQMAQLADRVLAGPMARQVRLVSVSFDPERDDPGMLADYGERHGADGTGWTIARPDAADLPGILTAYGVTAIPDRHGGFVHNTALHVVAPDGRLRAILDMDDLDGAEAALAQALR